MKTFQDYQKIGDSEQDRMAFVLSVIADAKSSIDYRTAQDADLYYRHMNPTIMRAQQIVYDVLGRAVNDPFKPNNKIPCRFYFYFVNQAVQYLLGNGVRFQDDKTKERLGDMFDYYVQRLLTDAMNGGVAFGFWNVDHLEIMNLSGASNRPAFAPLYDEDTGALRAGVRFWQIDEQRPLRASLFEEDGVTEYIRRRGEDMEVLTEKRPYVQIVGTSEAAGSIIYGGQNWPGLPVIPLYNVNHQSELVGSKASIDAYDLMMSGLVNNVDEGNLIYWVIQNAGGMNDMDDQRFIERLKTIHVAHTENDETITPQSIQANVAPNETALERLRKQMFEDFMALDAENIASGAATATQIKAAYERLNIKSNLLDGQVTEFILNLLKLLGIDDYPTYQPDPLVNKGEDISVVLQSAEYLSEEYITKKLLTIMGDIDQFDEVMAQRLREDTSRYETPKDETDETEETVPETETVEE